MKRRAKQAPLPILLLFVLLLGGCVSAESWEAARLLEDIDAAGAPTALKQQTPEPARSTERYSIDGRAHVADFYHPRQGHGGALLLVPGFTPAGKNDRSEEHTSELQSLMSISYAVFCLKKKKHITT